MQNSDCAIVLCADIGTTAIKLLLVQSSSRQIMFSDSCNIEVPGSVLPAAHSEMSLHAILDTFASLVSRAQSVHGVATLGRVSDILLCGQMHGIAMWQQDKPLSCCSELVTWQDGRCTTEFLASLPKPAVAHVVSPKTGFGLATLLWYQRHQPERLRLSTWDACGTAMDWLAAVLTGCGLPVRMSAQLAASWGYFDLATSRWDVGNLTSAGLLPLKPRLPEIAPVGAVLGQLASSTGPDWLRCLSPVCRIRLPLGDLQCVVYSVYAPLVPAHRHAAARDARSPDFNSRAFLNFGTSAQLGFLTREPPPQPALASHPGLDCFPFFSPDRYVLLAASLNGGNVLAEFMCTLTDWQEQLTGVRCPTETIWQRLQALADEADPSSASNPDPVIFPTLLDERDGSSGGAKGGMVSGLRTGTCRSLGRVYRSLCLGLIDNLLRLCPPSALQQAGVDRISLAGSALRRNAVLRLAAVRRFSDYGFQCSLAADDEASVPVDAAAGLAAQFLDGHTLGN